MFCLSLEGVVVLLLYKKYNTMGQAVTSGYYANISRYQNAKCTVENLNHMLFLIFVWNLKILHHLQAKKERIKWLKEKNGIVHSGLRNYFSMINQ